jgi:hypothetical protein
MELDPLRRGAILAVPAALLAVGATQIHTDRPTIKPQPITAAPADSYTYQQEMHDQHQQLIDARKAEVARSAARASRSRRLVKLSNIVDDVHELGGCESGDDPTTNTGNGYYGLTQFDMQTWRSNGYTKYAPRPDLASYNEQVAATIDLHSKRGWEPWPTCARKLGLFTHVYVHRG